MKIIVGGQVNKQKIADKVEEVLKEEGREDVEVTIMSDLKGASAIKKGKGDYYLGACHTGGGGALGMAMSLLTSKKCETISMPGNPPKEEKVKKAVDNGKVAFGFTAGHLEKAVDLIIRNILRKEAENK